jgi:hypothetical protein
MNLLKLLLCLPFFAAVACLPAQPEPGDLYREYSWYNVTGDCNGALRVGGRFDYRNSGQVKDHIGNGLIRPSFSVNLEDAVKAELVVEKMLCHGGTEGLRVFVNGNNPIPVPAPLSIPEPQSAYPYHYNEVVPVDLTFLQPGVANTFAFEVDTSGPRWPQNLIYGIILRIYYNPTMELDRAVFVNPPEDGTIGETALIRLNVPDEERLDRIELVGYYEGPDMDGDGVYTGWHYHYHKCVLLNHIGTITKPPFEYNWDTHWIPDQKDPIRLAAFVHLEDGLIYMTGEVKDIRLYRPGISVEFCRPFDQPEGWFTREGVFSQKFNIETSPEEISEAKMVFRTWSPGYFNGIYINDFLVFIREGPRYDYFEHHVPIEEFYTLKKGINTLTTGKTPLFHGEMVHGVEVQWPGIMLLLRVESP